MERRIKTKVEETRKKEEEERGRKEEEEEGRREREQMILHVFFEVFKLQGLKTKGRREQEKGRWKRRKKDEWQTFPHDVPSLF